jgi:GT2 family glycosyltransferase
MSGIWPVAVVIPNWNQGQVTAECVASVLAAAQDLPVFVCVVDNGSTDGSPDLLAQAFGDRVSQVRLMHNAGFAAAVNAGILAMLAQSAGAVLLLNNDTVVAPDMLAILAQAAEAQPAVGILGPAIFYFDTPTRVWRLGDRQYRWSPLPLRVQDREAERSLVPVDYLTGCAMLIRRQVLEGIGLFDEQFFFYYEDADFCRRAATAGWRLVCVPPARLWHKVSLTAGKANRLTGYWRARGQVLFYRKHSHGWSGAGVHAFVVAKTTWLAARQAISKRSPDLALATLRGMRDGYRAPLRSEVRRVCAS